MVWTNGWGMLLGAWPSSSRGQMLSRKEHREELLNGSQLGINQGSCVCSKETDKGCRSGLFILGFPGSEFASTPPREGSQVALPHLRTLPSSWALCCLPALPPQLLPPDHLLISD